MLLRLKSVGDSSHVFKYRIPGDRKVELAQELSLLGVNKFHLFPELESLGEMLREDQNAINTNF